MRAFKVVSRVISVQVLLINHGILCKLQIDLIMNIDNQIVFVAFKIFS